MKKQITTLSEFQEVLLSLISEIIDTTPSNQSVVIALSGDLGVGKTTAVQYVAQKLGVDEQIQSPTFVIKKIYPLQRGRFTQLMHTDAYRLENQSVEPLRFQDDFDNPQTISFVEWPEIIKDVLPSHTHWIMLYHGEKEGERIIEYKKTA